jgi:hypothetical protein
MLMCAIWPGGENVYESREDSESQLEIFRQGLRLNNFTSLALLVSERRGFRDLDVREDSKSWLKFSIHGSTKDFPPTRIKDPLKVAIFRWYGNFDRRKP